MRITHLAPLLPLAALVGCSGPATVSHGVPAAPATADERTTASDADGDGRPDTWTFARREGGRDVPVRREKDLDGDGKVDEWEELDAAGQPSLQRIDADRDGEPDVVLAFTGGALVRRELRVGGKARVWQRYEGGQLVRKERDTDGDGRPDHWEEWTGGQLRRVGLDRDGDGKADSWDVARPDGKE